MTRLHVATPNAKPMELAVREAFDGFGIPQMGGASADGWSKLADFQRCPYRYNLLHEEQVEIPGSAAAPLEIGILYHAALACHYLRLLPVGYPGYVPFERVPSPLAFIEAVEARGPEILYVAEARRLVMGYLEFWPLGDVQPVAIEYAAGREGVHTCRFDLVGWYDDELWVFEHKTAARETPELMDAWFLDGEVLGEMYGWEISGLDRLFGQLAGVVINIAFKSRPPRYRRLQVVVPEAVKRAYRRDRAHFNNERRRMRASGYWPRKLQGCLSRYGDLCALFPHCRDGLPIEKVFPRKEGAL